jgi:hypothetical protein
MHGQMFAYKINILFYALFDLLNLYGFSRAAGYAFGKYPGYPDAIVTAGIQIGDKIREDDAEGTGNRAGFTTGTAHLIALQVPVRGAL